MKNLYLNDIKISEKLDFKNPRVASLINVEINVHIPSSH